MSDKKYAVPEEELKAAMEQFDVSTKWLNPSLDWSPIIEPVPEAFIRKQDEKLAKMLAAVTHGDEGAVRFSAIEDVRRMYLTPDESTCILKIPGTYKINTSTMTIDCPVHTEGHSWVDLAKEIKGNPSLWRQFSLKESGDWFPQDGSSRGCPIEKALRDSGVSISNDWLCPECERVHEAILTPEMYSGCQKGVDDLLWQGKKLYDHQPHELNAAHDEDVKEAFLRGKASK